MSDERDNRELEQLDGTDTLARPESETQTPSYFRVVILNDDFTPRDFVVLLLQKFFGKSETEATKLMMQVHTQGAGVAGIYTHEIAETKCYQANSFSRQNQHPLKCIIEED